MELDFHNVDEIQIIQMKLANHPKMVLVVTVNDVVVKGESITSKLINYCAAQPFMSGLGKGRKYNNWQAAFSWPSGD
jgi:hypothetical protein